MGLLDGKLITRVQGSVYIIGPVRQCYFPYVSGIPFSVVQGVIHRLMAVRIIDGRRIEKL